MTLYICNRALDKKCPHREDHQICNRALDKKCPHREDHQCPSGRPHCRSFPLEDCPTRREPMECFDGDGKKVFRRVWCVKVKEKAE